MTSAIGLESPSAPRALLLFGDKRLCGDKMLGTALCGAKHRCTLSHRNRDVNQPEHADLRRIESHTKGKALLAAAAVVSFSSVFSDANDAKLF